MEARTKWHEKGNFWIGTLALIVAIIAIIIQTRPKTRELTCNVLSSSELTAASQIPSLTSAFTYNGKPILHLWKVSLLLVNSGNETLVGEGLHSTLIGDGIVLGFTNQMEIVNVETSDTLHQLKIEHPSTNSFKLKFAQWMCDEKSDMVIYVASTSEHVQPLMPVSFSRDIADGKIIVKNAALALSSRPPSAIEKFPAVVRIPTKILLTIISFLLFLFGLVVAPCSIWNYIRLSRWKNTNRTTFELYLKSISAKLIRTVEYYVQHPEALPKELWKDFKGERFTEIGLVVEFDSWSEVLYFSITFIALGILGGVYVTSILADIFPAFASHF